MTYGGLFEGIGGFALAAQWAGITPVWSNEIDPYCCHVLRKNFNHRIIEDDIRNIGDNLEPVDIICGGFPCQPFSTAGKRKGTKDDRHLWPQMLRVIRQVRPRWVVGENVRGLLSIEGGVVFESCCTDLETEGYEVQAFVIPACAVNAPHRRDRVWIVAKDSKRIRCDSQEWKEESNEREQRKLSAGVNEWRPNEKRPTPDTGGIGQQGQRRPINASDTSPYADWKASWSYDDGRWPTVSPLRRRNDGFPSWLVRSAIKAYGNAIVPKNALQIFKAIKETEKVLTGS